MSLIIGIIIRPLAYFFPKKRNLILFIGGGDGQLRDNIKYLYLQMVRSRQERFELYFLTEDKKLFSQLRSHDLPVLLYPRWSTVIIMLKTSILIVDNFEWIRNFKYHLLADTFKVQLWHGCSIKKPWP